MTTPTRRDVDRVRGDSTEHLGGASEPEMTVFHADAHTNVMSAGVPSGEEILSHATLLVLESLGRCPNHGDAIAFEVERRTGAKIGQNEMMAAVARLVDLGLVTRTTDTQMDRRPRQLWTLTQRRAAEARLPGQR